MAKNKVRVGEIKKRSQFFNFLTHIWQKRDLSTGRFVDAKTSGGKFKGVRRENRKRSK